MPSYRLIISVPFECDEEFAISESKMMIRQMSDRGIISDEVALSLTREGDRAALNLLLPRIEGRFGSHYQGRKAKLSEVV